MNKYIVLTKEQYESNANRLPLGVPSATGETYILELPEKVATKWAEELKITKYKRKEIVEYQYENANVWKEEEN